jgi:transcriptional regulator GlxA family with amidase domain
VKLRLGVTAAAEPFSRIAPAPWVVVTGLGSSGPEETEARVARPDIAAAIRWLRTAQANGARIASSCTGVFLLAEAGLLDGRKCTTSWWLQGLLARRTPKARVQADAMVVADDPIWTAGPAYGHLDLMLTVLAKMASAELAQAVGRRLSADRRASQGGFIEPAEMGASPVVASLEAEVSARLGEKVTLDQLAAAAGCSARTLARRIEAETGLSPMRFVQKVKLDAALRLIRAGDLPLARIAERIGLADAAALHRLVVRHTARAPGSFRRA